MTVSITVPDKLWLHAANVLTAAGLLPVPVETGPGQSPRCTLAESDARPVAGGITLTDRELQVLRGMSQGKSNGHIGRELYLSEDTVKTHARRLFRKLGARDRAHAVHIGWLHGLLGGAS